MNTEGFTWFEDSPDTGPECLCSKCGKAILEGDTPIRLWDDEKGKEARFHIDCWNEIQQNHLKTFRIGEPLE